MIELIKAMVQFKRELGIIEKNCQGQTGNRKFSYADLEGMEEATKEPLINNGLWVRQYLQQHEDGTHLHTDIYHISGEMLPSNCLIDYEAKDIKDHGGNISYFRRYTFGTTLGLVAADKKEKENVEDKPHNTFTKKEAPAKKIDIEDPYKKLRTEIHDESKKLSKTKMNEFMTYLKDQKITVSAESDLKKLESVLVRIKEIGGSHEQQAA